MRSTQLQAFFERLATGQAGREDFERLTKAEQDYLLSLPLCTSSGWAPFFSGSREDLERLLIRTLSGRRKGRNLH